MESRSLMKNTLRDPDYMKSLVEEWSPFLQGIKHPHVRAVMAQLAQNQFTYLDGLTEETFSTNAGAFTKFIFPLLRRVFPNLIAQQLFSVQPLNAPVGAVFYWEWKYGDKKGNVDANQNLIQNFNRYYSAEFIDYEVKNTGPATTVTSLTSASTGSSTFQWLPIFPADPAKPYVLTLFFVDGNDSIVKTINDDGGGNLVFTATGENCGTVTYSTGAWSINLATVTGTPSFLAGEVIYATYYYDQERVNPDLTTGTQKSKIPEINFDVEIQEIKAKRRSLKFRTSTEAMDDVRAFHGVNGESMLVAGMAQQMALGLDREMLDDVTRGAKYSATYSYGPAFGGVDLMRPLESIRELMTTINAVSAAIQKGSNRAPANFIVTSPEISSLFEQLTTHGDYMSVNRIEDPEVASSYGDLNSQYPINNIGTLLKRYRVFEDPYIDTDTILVGLRGRDYIDAGYVFAPYIPLEVTPTFLDPDDMTFRKGMRTRYATKLLRPEYYGVITVSGLPTVSVV